MLQTERIGDDVEAIKAALEGLQATIQTSQPGIVHSWDSTDGTVTVQPAIQGVTFLPQGNQIIRSLVTLRLIIKCPVQFPCGGGFTFTFPLIQGDEGILVGASRCIDAWWQNGGVSAPLEDRMHHLTDAFFIPGIKSVPNAISGISTTSIRMGKLDQSAYAEITAAGVFNVVAPGGANINGVTVDSSGNTAIPGTTTGTHEGTFNGGHTVSAHKHMVDGIQTGSSNVNSQTPTG